jgi:CRP-like cAMP-binding protein
MYAQLQRIEEYIEALPQDLKAKLEQASTFRKYKKGVYLLQAGEAVKFSYLILKGAARKFSLIDGEELTTAFFLPNDLMLAYSAYTLQKPSTEYLQAITDLEVQATHFEAFEQLKQTHAEFIQLDLLLTEYHALWLEEKLLEFYTLDAAGRYQKLLQKEPELFLKVPLGQIASYLGISQETLSRLRAK